ncbi:DEAD/DEAH box helicase [Bacillus sp. 2205SS5-2]|uniref:DEAD/DEAH box helicase n=1 Tax=Bacillus sp. 2205SS5-2 TaxID=3109031 RepID=UPI003007DD6D
MLKTNSYHLNISPSQDGTFFLTVKDPTGMIISPKDWRKQFFVWHEESFFGTMFKPSKVGGEEGLVIPSYHLLTLFGNEGFSRLIQWDWGELANLLLMVSTPMLDSISQGSFLPTFSNQKIQWRVPEDVWDEFGEDFWQQSATENMSARELVTQWFQESVAQYIQYSPQFKRLAHSLSLLENSELTSTDIAAYFDEKRWSEWIGLSEPEHPFSIGLRLSEPDDETQPWQLTAILKDPSSETLYESNSKEPLPRGWKKHLPAVKEEQQRWIAVFPELNAHGKLKTDLSEHEAWEFLTVTSEKLLALGVDIFLPSWWLAMKEANMTVKAKVKNSESSYRPSFVGMNAVLDFDWRVSMNGTDLSEKDFNSLVSEQRRLVQINGQWMSLDPAMIRRIQELMEKAKKDGLRIQDLLEQELGTREKTADEEEEYDPRLFANIQIELNRSLKKMVSQLQNLAEIPMIETPDTLLGTLRPYQQQGTSWLLFLRSFGFGAVLADDMGLGKTIQLISYLLAVKEQEALEAPALIIAPTSVLGNWQKELEKFSPSLNVLLHYGSNRAKGEAFTASLDGVDVVVTSYGLSHLDEEEIAEVKWSTIALDEAQNIKNSSTKQSRAIRKLQSGHHIALTGTPMENRLSELWSIFDFANKGFLGTFAQFQKHYILPIEKEDSREKISELQGKIKPFLLRRTKKDPDVELNLPDKLEQKEYCPLTPEQASLYEQLIQDTFDQINKLKGIERKGLILQMINRLKQLCNHPALYLKEPQPKHTLSRSYKLAKLVDVLENVLESGEACLIFTQYISMGEMIQTLLKEQFDIDVPFLNGSMPKQKRDQLVEDFQSGKYPVFLLSLKAGGTGLNLTAANHVIHYDRWWNPAVENQATDRAYRIGQNRFVHVHKLITSGTLEEKIDMMLEKKQALNDDIIQSDSWITELSDHDLKDLLTLK